MNIFPYILNFSLDVVSGVVLLLIAFILKRVKHKYKHLLKNKHKKNKHKPYLEIKIYFLKIEIIKHSIEG